MLIEITILNGNGRFLEVITNLVGLDHQFIIIGTLIFPQELAIAVIILGDRCLDTLGEFARADLVEIFAEVSEQAAEQDNHHNDGDTENF